MNMREIVNNSDFDHFEGQFLRLDAECVRPVAVVDPRKITVEVAHGADAQLVLLHTVPHEGSICVEMGEGARLSVAQIFTDEAFISVAVSQAESSRCSWVVAELSSANVSFKFSLDGSNAESNLSGVFVASEREHCGISVRTDHRAPDCRSNSLVKGVAGGEATGEFNGLVYVDRQAQRTDARQQSRNILLSEQAHIRTQPQLEIYADDVKCSHGATVGQLDAQAVLYMRQRGLSEAQARALQIEGFVGDVVGRCQIDSLRDSLTQMVLEKLHTM